METIGEQDATMRKTAGGIGRLVRDKRPTRDEPDLLGKLH